MIDVRFRPMADPKTHRPRKRSPFRSSYQQTLRLLEDELNSIRATEIVIEAGFDLGQIRNDGWPRSTARPTHAAVRLSFRSRGRSLAMPCDTYDCIDDNLRAIALSLQALRAVDRYGVTSEGEQYKGWTALPPAPTAGRMSRDEAARFLSDQSLIFVSPTNTDAESVSRAYRTAAMRLHPDQGGDPELFLLLQEAKRVLEGGDAMGRAG